MWHLCCVTPVLGLLSTIFCRSLWEASDLPLTLADYHWHSLLATQGLLVWTWLLAVTAAPSSTAFDGTFCI